MHTQETNHQTSSIETLNAVAEQLDDLAVNDTADIKGGVLLPAVQKVREAAARDSGANTSGRSASHALYQDITIPAS